MKQVIIFHGTGGNPDQFWFPYIRQNLPQDQYHVEVPQLPDADMPVLDVWLDFAIKNFSYSSDTILVGHSSGCPLILSLLQQLQEGIVLEKIILVAGFCESLTEGNNPILQEQYNWEKIKKHVKKFIFINSVDDPWGCSDLQGRTMFDHLGGDLLIRSNEGHMGSVNFDQPYRDFPILKSFIEN